MSAHHTILVVDDEEQMLRMLRPTLEAEGYTVLTAVDRAGAVALLKEASISAIILDLGLPDADGKDVIREVRQSTRDLPIVVLSARGSVAEKIAALDLGANDYVAKPFPVDELLARLRVALRGQTAAKIDQFSREGVHIDFTTRRMSVRGRPIRLSTREAELVRALVRAGGEPVSYKDLLAAVWPGKGDADAQYVRVLVNQLRQKLQAEAPDIELLITEPGLGYRLALEKL